MRHRDRRRKMQQAISTAHHLSGQRRKSQKLYSDQTLYGNEKNSGVKRFSRQCRNMCSTVASVKISTASACTIRMWPLSGQRKKWQKLYSDQTLYGNEKNSGVKRFSRQCRNACSTVASVEIEKIAAADPTGRGKVVRTPALAKCWMNGRLFTARWVRAARLRKDCKNCCPRHCP
jgi:hypothetical protein